MRPVPIILAALPTATAAATFLITWIRPATFGPDMVRDLVGLMAMEFVMMHATGMMIGVQMLGSSRAGRLTATALLIAPYAVFAIGVPLAWDAPWLIASFALLVGGKLVSAWRLPPRQKRFVEFATWGSSFFAYLLFVLLAFLAPFPASGGAIRLPGGDKMENPGSIVAAGLIYFLALTAAQVVIQARVARQRSRTIIVCSEAPSEPVSARVPLS